MDRVKDGYGFFKGILGIMNFNYIFFFLKSNFNDVVKTGSDGRFVFEN